MASSTPDRRLQPALETRIVGIGASAGGLVALEQFLQNVPPRSGLAYVVVQHLDPTQKAMLAQLLQRVTALRVREAEKDTHVEPNFVYVIPPNTELSVVHGTLKLRAPAEPRGMRLPINVLFSSLASAQGERAIAVVLSGMGTDGTLGLQAVKAMGGLTVAQPISSLHPPKCRPESWRTSLKCPIPASLPLTRHPPRPGRWTISSRYCKREPATTFRSTSRARCTGGSNGAWPSTP
jgi:CheB methylesterase